MLCTGLERIPGLLERRQRRQSQRGKPAGAKAAIASVLALLGATALAPAYALPSGGTVVGGSANGEIHLSGGNSLSVNQKVDKLIANWDSFSVAAASG